MITGLNGYICEDCARQAYDIVCAQGFGPDGATSPGAKSSGNGDVPVLSDVPKPNEIKEYLDQYIIGQDEASVCSSQTRMMAWRLRRAIS